MTTPPNTPPPPSRLPALLTAIATCLIACLTLSLDPAAGESATLLARHGNIDSSPTPFYPLWSTLLLLLRPLPFATFAYRAGLLSAIAAAVCIYLLVRLIQHGPRAYITTGKAPYSALFSAAPAVAFLLLALPFEVAADRAHPMLFHIALLLASLRGIQRYSQGEGIPFLLFASFLAGLALPEWWGITLCSPALLVYAWNATQRRALEVPYGALFMIIAWLIGLTTGLVSLRVVLLVLGRGATLMPDFLPALSELFHLTLASFRHESSALTWSAFLFAGALPACLILYCANHLEIGSPPEWIILHGVLTVLPLCVLGAGVWAPMTLPSPFNSLLQLLTFLSAVTLGYACMFWYSMIDELSDESPPLASTPLVALLAGVLLVLTGITMQQFPRPDLRATRIVNAWTKHALLPIEDETVVVGSGPLLHELMLVADEARRPLHFVDEGRYHEPRYLHNLHIGSESTPLMMLAYRNPTALRAALLTDRETSTHTIAFLEPPDPSETPWTNLQPSAGLYITTSDADRPLAKPTLDETWEALAEALPAGPTQTPFPNLMLPLREVRIRTARLANDLAVQAFQANHAQRALSLLSTAARLDPSNRVPEINRVLVSAASGHVSTDDRAWESFADLLCTERLRFQDIGGYNPRSGRLLFPPRMALLQRALPPSLSTLPTSNSSREAVTRFLIDDPNASTAATACAQSPANQPIAGVLIALNGVVQENQDTVDAGLALMKNAEQDTTPLLLGAAEWHRNRGDFTASAAFLFPATERDPANLEALEAETIMQLTSAPTMEGSEFAERLGSLEPGNPYGRLFQAAQYIQQGNPELATDALISLRNSQRVPALTLQLAYLLEEVGRENEAISTARDAIALGSPSVGYWEALASLLHQLKQRELARFATRRATLLKAVESTQPDFTGIILDRLAQRGATEVAPPPARPSTPIRNEEFPVAPSLEVQPTIAAPVDTPAPRVDIDDEDQAAPVPLGW